MREDRGRFARLRDQRVLLYWPHGLGDWVHLGVLAPLLEPSNRYAVTRAGDDYVAMLEGQTLLQPLYGGTLVPSDRLHGEPAHWGLRQASLRGAPVTAQLSPDFEPAVRAFDPTDLLWTDYPETEGRSAYPYHTKMRNLARLLVDPNRLGQFDLSQPLPNTLDFATTVEVRRSVEERLAAFAPPGTRVAIISRAGVTAPRKNWETAQAERFVRELHRYDSRWRTVSMDGDDFEATAGYRELLGDLRIPFAATFKALLQRSELMIGVPAGPLHVAMASNAVAVVGIWRAHHPDWYDEPNARAAHLVGNIVRDRKFHLRPATTTKPPSLQHRLSYVDTDEIPADAALQAAIDLVG
ncbi:MAG TPA: hypothetical protein VGK84_02895 [Candidatus Tumulicola sp.]|jgi:ADP-heptose:LPS heptosyltransferase